MKIPFRHIGKIPQPFDLGVEGVSLKGTLWHKEGELFQMQADLQGKVTVQCDICAEQYDIMLDDDIELLLSDGIYSGMEQELDIVEMAEHVDMDELLHSEVELIKSDYHKCNACLDDGL